MRTFILANPGEMRSASFESFSSGTWLTSLMDAMEQKLPDFKTIFNKLFSLLIQQPQSSQIFVSKLSTQRTLLPARPGTLLVSNMFWWLTSASHPLVACLDFVCPPVRGLWWGRMWVDIVYKERWHGWWWHTDTQHNILWLLIENINNNLPQPRPCYQHCVSWVIIKYLMWRL